MRVFTTQRYAAGLGGGSLGQERLRPICASLAPARWRGVEEAARVQLFTALALGSRRRRARAVTPPPARWRFRLREQAR